MNGRSKDWDFGCKARVKIRLKRPGGRNEGFEIKSEIEVDAETGPAKVTLPLITADSQVSEWFCEHAATASVSKRSIGRREAWLERRCETGQSSLIVWFSEFLGRWALKRKASAEQGSARVPSKRSLEAERFSRKLQETVDRTNRSKD